jgi:hypothetical protein
VIEAVLPQHERRVPTTITSNSSTGDELFSATPSGSGRYHLLHRLRLLQIQLQLGLRKLSTGDGGGFGHIGSSYNGDIEHNTFIFNQSTNPTIPTNAAD